MKHTRITSATREQAAFWRVFGPLYHRARTMFWGRSPPAGALATLEARGPRAYDITGKTFYAVMQDAKRVRAVYALRPGREPKALRRWPKWTTFTT